MKKFKHIPMMTACIGMGIFIYGCTHSSGGPIPPPPTIYLMTAEG